MADTPDRTARRLYIRPESAAYRYHQLVHRGATHADAHGTVCREFGVAFHERTPYEWRRRLCARAARKGALPEGSGGTGRERYRLALRALFE